MTLIFQNWRVQAFVNPKTACSYTEIHHTVEEHVNNDSLKWQEQKEKEDIFDM